MKTPSRPKARALGLFSGGLDSILAAKVLMDQGIDVIAVSFKTPFFGPETATKAAQEIGIRLLIEDITALHLEIVRSPRYGYGAHMNPCIDCHGLMAREALRIVREQGYDFVFTGEVLNERPMSQTKNSLRAVAKLSGCPDLLLRPLSARLLAETAPEREGLVDRAKLLDIQGRSRVRQLALAQHYGIKEFPTPAGGCVLTDAHFSRRLKELFSQTPHASVKDIELLKVGRHFRIEGRKVIIGRNKDENQFLRDWAEANDTVLSAEHVPGPVALVCGGGPPALLALVGGICARYSDAKHANLLPHILVQGVVETSLTPARISEEVLEAYRI